MKVSRRNAYRSWLIGAGAAFLLIGLVVSFFIGRSTNKDTKGQLPVPQLYAQVPSPVGTMPVLPTLPPAPVPSVAPSIVASVGPTNVAGTAVPTALTQPAPNKVQVLYERSFDSWSYIANRVGNEPPSVNVRVNDSSVSTLKSFIELNKQYASQLAVRGNQIAVRVIFRNYMDIESYKAWAKTSGITYYEIVCLPGADLTGGPSGSLCIFPQSSDPLPASTTDLAYQSISDVKGVYFVKGRIASERLPMLIADPYVLLTDLTDNMVIRDLKSAGIPDADRASISNNMRLLQVIDLFQQSK